MFNFVRLAKLNSIKELECYIPVRKEYIKKTLVCIFDKKTITLINYERSERIADD